MGIRIKSNSKAKASVKLRNEIATYLFEQELGELRGNTKAILALRAAAAELSIIINNSK